MKEFLKFCLRKVTRWEVKVKGMGKADTKAQRHKVGAYGGLPFLRLVALFSDKVTK